jgi:hypothetical protein
MKRKMLVLMSTITLFGALAVPIQPAAQEAQRGAEGISNVDTDTANPVPLINQPLVPDAAKPGGAGFTLTVNGTGFVKGAAVDWNGSALATTFVSGSQLTAKVPASDIKTASTASVTVVNPGPGGGTSNVAFFSVTVPTSSVALGAPTGFGVGSDPEEVAVADFNGDGKLGLAVSNYGSNNVSVLLGNGDGTFQAAVNYDVRTNPTGIAAGDFKGDGKLDLAVSNYGSNNVSVLLGNGDGTFQAAVNYDVGTNPTSVAVGDFKGDGELDLAVSNYGSNNVSVLLGNGDGTFQAAVNYGAGTLLTGIAVGDFNGDGKLDLAVLNQNASVSILLGNGDGTFQAPVSYAVGDNDVTIATADLNGDGKLDLAVADYAGAVWILLGNGDGTFQTPVSYGPGGGESSPWGLAIADFSGDGKLDLVVSEGPPGGSPLFDTLQVFLGNGDGTFQAPLTFPGGSSPLGLAVGDFAESGRLDVAVADRNADAVSILLRTTLAPTSLTFATQLVGTTSSAQSVTLTNYGKATLSISSITIKGADPGDFAQTNTCGSSLASGASCTINVTFKPTLRGSRTARLSVSDNAPGSPQTASLTGTGTVVEFNPTSLIIRISEGTGYGSTTLTNTGSTALSITSITVTPNPPFSEFENNCGSSVGAGESCTIWVAFSPKRFGDYQGTMSVSDNGGGSPQQVPLAGIEEPK